MSRQWAVFILAALLAYLFSLNTNRITVRYGYIEEYHGRTIKVCNVDGCENFDDFTFRWNNPDIPIVEGRGVQILDCKFGDTCGLLDRYDTVPALISE